MTMPCPFCGGNELDTPESGEVFCRMCKALGPDAPRGKGIDAWNRRAVAPMPAVIHGAERADVELPPAELAKKGRIMFDKDKP